MTLLSLIIALSDTEAPTWWDYPGLEAWKFLNLLIFVGVMVYFLKRPLTDAFLARREAIRRDLVRAREEKEQSLAKLAEVQLRLNQLDSEVARIQDQSRSEAEAERERIAQQTESEILKLREQAQREITGAGKVARYDLRRFAARESVKVAGRIIRREIRSEDDTQLIAMNVDQLGRA